MPDATRLRAALRHWRRFPEVLACLNRTPQRAAVLAGYLGLRQPSYPLELSLPGETRLTLQCRHDLITAWVIWFREEYQVDPGYRSILDLGANIGCFSLHAAIRAPAAQIVALEPFPSTYARLVAHVRRNGLEGRVRCRRLAVAPQAGARRMAADPGLPSQDRGLLGPGDVGQGLEVEAVTLDELLRQEGFQELDLLKMDIEGAEHEVLGEAPPEVLRRVRCIALEYHPRLPKRTLFDHLVRAGFRPSADVVAHPDSGVAHFQRVGCA